MPWIILCLWCNISPENEQALFTIIYIFFNAIFVHIIECDVGLQFLYTDLYNNSEQSWLYTVKLKNLEIQKFWKSEKSGQIEM